MGYLYGLAGDLVVFKLPNKIMLEKNCDVTESLEKGPKLCNSMW